MSIAFMSIPPSLMLSLASIPSGLSALPLSLASIALLSSRSPIISIFVLFPPLILRLRSFPSRSEVFLDWKNEMVCYQIHIRRYENTILLMKYIFYLLEKTTNISQLSLPPKIPYGYPLHGEIKVTHQTRHLLLSAFSWSHELALHFHCHVL